MATRRKTLYKLDTSPFYNIAELNTKTRLKPLSYNEEEDYYITKRIIYKSEEFVKAIIPNKLNITEYFKLSSLAKNLLYYIVNSCLEYNSLTFTLDISVFGKLVGVNSDNRIYNAIKQLIEAKYIARTDTKKVYWINHNRYYKGNYLVIKTIESV